MKKFHLYIVYYILVALTLVATSYSQPMLRNVREPVAAGRFYPSDENVLRTDVESYLVKVPKQNLPGKPVALISPNAGYKYTGIVAAHGYNTIKGRNYKRIIILAPTHYGRFKGVSISRDTHYQTPLGPVAIDDEVCNKLLDQPPLFGTDPEADKREYSIEVQLPFLQSVLKDFKIVPLLLGNLKKEDIEKVAEAIKSFVTDDTLLIASSDFTHYGDAFNYAPFRKDIEENIKKLDYGAFERILALDSEGFLQYRIETGITADGFLPIGLLLRLLPPEAKGTLLTYETSGKQSGDFTYSVSYASIVFTK
ncbi:MAG TPA: AmmeMemoRadiSam system protein B [Candidatus Brocadiia bacterium]|nr:AmmeMemoRadiSam system protein B [Planctomycetota bacterium]MDO8092146.1 AmmeMemoRadiSam system protein B [Candidatus Brocadiales bacterium]